MKSPVFGLMIERRDARSLCARRPLRSVEDDVSATQTSVLQKMKRWFSQSRIAGSRHCEQHAVPTTIASHNEGTPQVINKQFSSAAEALADIPDGAVVGIGGFGNSGVPLDLIDALIDHAPHELTIVSNNAGGGEVGLARLLQAGLARKLVCSFPRSADSYVFDGLYRSGKLALELVPQGTLAERLRAAGARIGAFFTPPAYGTVLAEQRETRVLNGKPQVLELPLHLDYALVKAECGDRWGNLTYRKLARNFGPVMAMAARCTVASVQSIVPLGELDPASVGTPGICVRRVVERSAAIQIREAA